MSNILNWCKQHKVWTTVIVIIVLAVALSAGGSTKPVGKVSYIVTPEGTVSEGSSTLHVVFQVKNTGKVTGTPWCTIKASSGQYGGFSLVTLSPIKPGVTSKLYFSDITITNNGAANIGNDYKINCS